MKKIIHLFLNIVLLLNVTSSAYSRKYTESQHYINIEKIEINNQVSELIKGSIVLSDTDSLKLSYYLKSNSNEKNNSDFFYKLQLTNGLDTSVSISGFNTASYNKLQQGKYYLIISAFAVKDQWATKNLVIPIIVDNKLSELHKKAKSLADDLTKSIDSLSTKKDKLGGGINKLIESPEARIGIVLLSFVLGFGFFFVIYSKKINSFNKVRKLIEKRGIKMSNPELAPITKEEYEKILSENAALKAELASMKGQIDAMNQRTAELSKRNKEVEEKLDKLTKSKNDLEELSKQKDELFAIVIHDIKNPAALIKNLVDLLRSYDLTANEQQEIIEDIAQTTLKIVKLSQEVTKILTLESGLMNLELEPAPINVIIEDVVTRNRVVAQKKKMTLFTELSNDLPDVEMDAQKIEEVLDNLISNAIKFTQEGGTVRVKAYKELRDIIVEVSDNGLGLSEDDVAKAFRRGQKLSASPTGGETSTGLGLWIVKKIIDAHHGRVWIKSILGKGSTFAFALPGRQPNKEN